MPLLVYVQQMIRERFAHVSRSRPLRVLELGSGCGLLGLGLAATCNAEVVLTDPAVAVNFAEDAESGNTLDWLRENVERNREAVGDRARVEQLAWGDADAAEALRRTCGNDAGFDLVVGSDLLYDPERYPGLLSSLHTFVGRGGGSKPPDDAPAAVLGYPTRHGRENSFWRMCEEGGELEVGVTLPIVPPPPAAGRFSATHLHRRNG